MNIEEAADKLGVVIEEAETLFEKRFRQTITVEVDAGWGNWKLIFNAKQGRFEVDKSQRSGENGLLKSASLATRAYLVRHIERLWEVGLEQEATVVNEVLEAGERLREFIEAKYKEDWTALQEKKAP